MFSLNLSGRTAKEHKERKVYSLMDSIAFLVFFLQLTAL
jgi:hypothetical protein